MGACHARRPTVFLLLLPAGLDPSGLVGSLFFCEMQMKVFSHAARAALVAGALLVGGAAWAGGAYVDPLDEPARLSPLAERGLVNGLARAGSRVVAVGQRGHILYSDDQGAHWAQAKVPVSVDLTAVYFADPMLGWAVGHDGVVLHSIDAGASWSRQLDGRKAADGQARPLLDVWFEDARRGMAVGAFGLALCTVDAGATWRSCEADLDNKGGLHLNAIRSVGGAVYIAGEQGLLLKRDAQGKFAPLASPYKGSFFGVTGNDGTVLAYGLRGNAYASHDGGKSWQKAETGVANGLAAGVALADGSLLLVSQAGQLLESHDRGATFRVHPLERPQSAAAALALPGGRLMVGGARGLQAQSLN
jgi:photosystem II stability/assembly factor-like uncharacterized protein